MKLEQTVSGSGKPRQPCSLLSLTLCNVSKARVLEEMANQQMPRASSDSNTSSWANETQASPVVTPNSAIARNAPRNVPASTYKYNRLGEAEIVT